MQHTGMQHTKHSADAGFTLMEVLVALVILSTSIYILLGHHFTIMGLQQTISDELIYNQLMETAVAKAEVGVLAEKLADAGDFGERFAEYAWHYEAILSGADELIPLYAINLTIDGPADSRTYKFFFYNTGNPETDGDSGGSSRNSNSRSNNSSSDRSANRNLERGRGNDRGNDRDSSRFGGSSSRGIGRSSR